MPPTCRRLQARVTWARPGQRCDADRSRAATVGVCIATDHAAARVTRRTLRSVRRKIFDTIRHCDYEKVIIPYSFFAEILQDGLPGGEYAAAEMHPA